MKKKFLYVGFTVLLIFLFVLIYMIFNLYKNYNLIKTIDATNMSYVTNNDYHINIKTIVKGEDFSDIDIYKKGFIIKTRYEDSENNENMFYENTDSGEYIQVNNSKISYSYTEKFKHFLETYYRNLSISKISFDDENYIVIFGNSKYYFDKENYRINRIEVYNDTGIDMEEIYTYFDNEAITNEMISKPEI